MAYLRIKAEDLLRSIEMLKIFCKLLSVLLPLIVDVSSLTDFNELIFNNTMSKSLNFICPACEIIHDLITVVKCKRIETQVKFAFCIQINVYVYKKNDSIHYHILIFNLIFIYFSSLTSNWISIERIYFIAKIVANLQSYIAIVSHLQSWIDNFVNSKNF